MKRIGILAAVFVLLLGVVALQRWQQSKVVVSEPALTVQVEPDRVTRIAVKRPDGEIELARTGGEWKLTRPVEYPANADLVNAALKAVATLKLEDVISTNPETRSTYQVDSTGTEVRIWTGDQEAMALVLGKSSQNWTHTFVRRIDRKEVYRAEGVISYNFSRSADDWRDKSILKLDETSVSRVVLEYPKEKLQFALVRADSVWMLAEGNKPAEAPDSLQAARLVTGVSKLLAANFATAAEVEGKDFGQADFRLAVEAGGTTHHVDFLSIDETKMLARREGTDTVFSLFKSSLGNLMKKPGDLRKPGA